jgi:hypothetical protein
LLFRRFNLLLFNLTPGSGYSAVTHSHFTQNNQRCCYLGLLVVALLEPLLPLLDDVVTGQQALVLSDLITSQNIKMSGVSRNGGEVNIKKEKIRYLVRIQRNKIFGLKDPILRSSTGNDMKHHLPPPSALTG